MALARELTRCVACGFEDFTSPFQDAWRQLLSGHAAARPRMLELGCGPANDYRFWNAYGIAALLDYVGVDVCAANINNARTRFPDVPFLVGDACRMDYCDNSFDVVFALDLLEHLSPFGLDTALTEIERLSRDEVWLSLFNATYAETHEYHEVGDYHWNTLSVSQISRHLCRAGYSTEVVSVATLLGHRFPGYRHYNRKAHIVIGKSTQHV